MGAALPTALSPVATSSSGGPLPQGAGLPTLDGQKDQTDGPPAFLPSAATEDADTSNLFFLTGQ